jgi:hypothetical protein
MNYRLRRDGRAGVAGDMRDLGDRVLAFAWLHIGARGSRSRHGVPSRGPRDLPRRQADALIVFDPTAVGDSA